MYYSFLDIFKTGLYLFNFDFMKECTIDQYIASKPRGAERIKAIDDIIDVMLIRLAEVAAGQNTSVDEYQLDDGQMKIRTKYRSPEDVAKAIEGLERTKQVFVNQYNGRVSYLRDSRSFR